MEPVSMISNLWLSALPMIVNFLSYQQLPELMQGVSMAFLTLLVSFAIAIVIEHVRDAKRDNYQLDLYVLFNHVWRFKRSLIFVGSAVIAPFFMSATGIVFKIFVFLLWVFSVKEIVAILLRVYDWVVGDKQSLRLEYLNKIYKSQNEAIISWQHAWKSPLNELNLQTKSDYFCSFANEVGRFITSTKPDDWRTAEKLLENFHTGILKKDCDFLLFNDPLLKIFEWHLAAWTTKLTPPLSNDKKKRDLYRHAFSIEYTLRLLIENKLIPSALSGKSFGSAHTYFDAVKSHLNTHIEVFIDDKYRYVQHFPIYIKCFDLISESNDTANLWEYYFPEEWKVEISNLQNGTLAEIWWRQFVDWSLSHNKEDGQFDNKIAAFFESGGFFGYIDTITWARLYKLALSPKPTEAERIKGLVEHDVGFGNICVISLGDSVQDIEKIHDDLELEAYKLALYLFPRIYTRDNILQWKTALLQFDYVADPEMERRRKMWLTLLTSLEQRLES